MYPCSTTSALGGRDFRGNGPNLLPRLPAWYLVSSLIVILLLFIDPHFNQPSGFLSLELLTGKPVRHGRDPCAWDYDGSWKVGGISGATPLGLNFSVDPLITCETVNTTSVSFVTTPFLHIPSEADGSTKAARAGRDGKEPLPWTAFYELRNLDTYTSEIGVAESYDRGATWQHVGTALSAAAAGGSLSSPFVVYDSIAGLYVMLPTVVWSRSAGLGSGLGSSSPGRRAGRGEGPQARGPPGSLPVYTTTPDLFPLGWTLAKHHRIPEPGSAQSAFQHAGSGSDSGTSAHSHAARRRASETDSASSSAAGSGGPDSEPDVPQGVKAVSHGSFFGTVAAHHGGRWWIWTTHLHPALLPWLPPNRAQLLYVTPPGGSLLGPWLPHPAAAPLQHGRVASGLAALPRWLKKQQHRSSQGQAPAAAAAAPSSGGGLMLPSRGGPPLPAGRPFVWQGALHRWVRPCRDPRLPPLPHRALQGQALWSRLCATTGELVLLRASAATPDVYAEEEVTRYLPAVAELERMEHVVAGGGGSGGGGGGGGAAKAAGGGAGEDRRGAQAQTRTWHAARLMHVDVQPVVSEARGKGVKGGEEGLVLVGLAAGDRYEHSGHHFMVHERWWVELKRTLGDVAAVQLLAVVAAAVVMQAAAGLMPGRAARSGGLSPVPSGSSIATSAGGSAGAGGKGGGGGGGGAAAAGGPPAPTYTMTHAGWVAALEAALPGFLPDRMRTAAADAGGTALARLQHAAAAVVLGIVTSYDAVRRAAARPAVQAVASVLGVSVCAFVGALALMAAAPSAVPCPRSMVHVHPFAESPHYVPDKPFVDPKAPFDVSNLTVITGCTPSFFDRLQNAVASVQYWEPDAPLVVYDLGLTGEQQAQVRCWNGVTLLRWPHEAYPPHVREMSTYAFKPLVYQHALKHLGAFLWLDCGLELRDRLDTFRHALAAHGHVSAQQSDSPSKHAYSERYTAPFLNLSAAEWGRLKDLPFCAGGLQGFVPGSAAERLILQPAVDCSMDALGCIAPPGHSRSNHMYDQTALTLALRRHNYSSCLPRETHCTSAVKKVSWDAFASSHPIVVASRRHRRPKPYQRHVVMKPGCVPHPASNPWRTVATEHPESTTKSSSLLFTLGFVYGQALGDFVIQAGCCLGLHVLVQTLLWATVLAIMAHRFLALKMHWSPALGLGLGLGNAPGRPLMQTHSHSHGHNHSHGHAHAHPHDGDADSGPAHRLVSPEASPSKWGRGPQAAPGSHHSGHQPSHGAHGLGHGHGHGHGQAALPLWARLLLLLPLPRVGLPAMAAASIVCALVSAAAMGATCRL